MERTYSLTASQVDMITACMAKAVEKDAFADCVVPSIGAKVLDMLARLTEQNAAAEAAARVTVHGKPWGGSPPRWIAGEHSDLMTLHRAGMAARTIDGWWIPTAVFPS